jgi:hypothetical protein
MEGAGEDNVKACRQVPIWMVLFCLGLMLAGGVRCLAADPRLPQSPASRIPAEIERKNAPQAQPAGGGAVATVNYVIAPANPAPKPTTLTDAVIGAIFGNQAAVQQQAQAAENQQLQAVEAELRPQFQQMLNTELAFMRRSCKPDANVLRDIAKAAKADLHAPVHDYAVAANSPRAGVVVDDPRAAVQKLLMPLAEKKLGAEKARLYRQECDKLAEARKHAAIMNLVAALDERLVLTSQQRAKLVESFTAKYDKSWEQQYQMFGIQYLPPIADQSILPLLDVKQKIVWQDTSKQQQNGEWSVDTVDFAGGNAIQEVAPVEEEDKLGP